MRRWWGWAREAAVEAWVWLRILAGADPDGLLCAASRRGSRCARRRGHPGDHVGVTRDGRRIVRWVG